MTTPHRPNSDRDRPTPGTTGIRQAAECRPLGSGYTALSAGRCDFDDGVLHLRGLVATYHLKQVALALVADIEGVHRVSNQIEVVARSGRTRP
jgi:osmotically-inducible protein OsmY